jgi:hypothetical protein
MTRPPGDHEFQMAEEIFREYLRDRGMKCTL